MKIKLPSFFIPGDIKSDGPQPTLNRCTMSATVTSHEQQLPRVHGS